MDAELGGTGTYAHVELDDTPDDKHGGVVVAVLNLVDLQVSHDGADGGEEAKRENANQAQLLLARDVDLEQHGDGQQRDHDVGHDGDDGIAREGGAVGDACSGKGWLP